MVEVTITNAKSRDVFSETYKFPTNFPKITVVLDCRGRRLYIEKIDGYSSIAEMIFKNIKDNTHENMNEVDLNNSFIHMDEEKTHIYLSDGYYFHVDRDERQSLLKVCIFQDYLYELVEIKD